MVEAHVVVQVARAGETVEPPTVPGLAHAVPAVRWIAPDLPLGSEAIGRRAGDLGQAAIAIEVEELGRAPDVGGIIRDVHGDITDHPDAVLMGVGKNLAPCGIEAILEVCLRLRLCGKAIVL